MAEQDPYRDLCSTCRNADSCFFARGKDRPILQCEEFDVCEHAPRRMSGGVNLPPAAAAGDESSFEDIDSSRYTGLCRNCEQRESCKFSKPEAGVWHCGEYR